MEGGKGLQSDEVMHDSGCVAVVRAEMESPHGWVLILLIPLTNSLLYGRALHTHWLGEVSIDSLVLQVQFLRVIVLQYPRKLRKTQHWEHTQEYIKW